MLGTLYRYPHPYDPTKFLYVGQGANRDKEHRQGKSSFGRRFKKNFPDVELPHPVSEEVEVIDGQHLNSMETAWMVLYHTLLREGGMNLLLPGSTDYKNLGHIGGRWAVESGHLAKLRTSEHQAKAGRAGGHIGGRIAGRKNIESGHLARMWELPQTKAARSANGRIQGRKAVESGQLDRIRELPQTKAAQRANCRIQGRKAFESGQLASITTHESCVKGGIAAGRISVESGHIAALGRSGVGGRAGGPTSGRKHVENRTGIFAMTPEQKSAAGRKGGRIGGLASGLIAVQSGQIASIQVIGSRTGSCMRWKISRGKPCVCGRHESQQAAQAA